MSVLDQFVLELESAEADTEMYFSLYFIPAAYQPQESSYD